MRNTAKVVREIGINNVRLPSMRLSLHLDHRLLGIAARAVSVLLRWKVSFEDRFEHQHRCCHAHPISQGRDAQWPQLAIGLRDKHSSDRVWPVSLLPERKRQFTEPLLHPVRFDLCEILAIDTR